MHCFSVQPRTYTLQAFTFCATSPLRCIDVAVVAALDKTAHFQLVQRNAGHGAPLVHTAVLHTLCACECTRAVTARKRCNTHSGNGPKQRECRCQTCCRSEKAGFFAKTCTETSENQRHRKQTNSCAISSFSAFSPSFSSFSLAGGVVERPVSKSNYLLSSKSLASSSVSFFTFDR